MTSDDTTRAWERKAAGMKGRALTEDEKAAVGEEILKGKFQPGTDSRAKKRAIRRAVENVKPGKA